MKDGPLVPKRLAPGAHEPTRAQGVVWVAVVMALLMAACDSLPFIGGGPDPGLEWAANFTGRSTGTGSAEATGAEGRILVEGRVWIPGAAHDLVGEIEARGSQLTLSLVPHRDPDIYAPPMSVSWDFRATITRLRSGTYNVTVICPRRCDERDLFEGSVTVH